MFDNQKMAMYKHTPGIVSILKYIKKHQHPEIRFTLCEEYTKPSEKLMRLAFACDYRILM